ncbi:MAG: peptide deformylase [Alphaproteobacteria bacterium]|nr:MAG: peptide deformylase [Alphaproteobacteria bacterium]
MPIEQLVRFGSARPIRRWADAVLHEPMPPVVDFGDALQRLLADMFATNTAAGGAGLAAPQVGVSSAAFVDDCVDENFNRQVGVVCNPSVEVDGGPYRRLETWEEGYLSLPGGYAELARPAVAVCRGQDQYGDPVEVRGTGLLVRCLQHETDHLNGIVSGDRLSSRKRRGLYESHQLAANLYPLSWPASRDDDVR